MYSSHLRKALNKVGVVQGGALTSKSFNADANAPLTSFFGPELGQARLSGNENPYGPAPSAIEAISKSVGMSCYYADRSVYRLLDMIAERNGVARSQVILASGTTEILCAAAMAWGSKGSIVCPDLFWDMPVQYAERKGVKSISTPLSSDMNFDLDAMASAVDDSVSLVYIVNPNNPTGLALDCTELRTFASKVLASGATVLVDEAYNELTDNPDKHSLMDLVRANENVIITRTFSKIYGMAGLRIGYAISSEENIAKIREFITSFGGNAAGLAAAIACYNDYAFLEKSRTAICEGRDQILTALNRLGLKALPSQTNFLFVEVDDADAVQRIMADHNIAIRGAFGSWKQYSRVSIGSPEDIQRYIDVLPLAIDR